MTQPPDGPDFSLADVAREGLIERPGAEPASHDGTGRVDLAFTVAGRAEDGASIASPNSQVAIIAGVMMPR